jgi:tetratricopeptide (TPR) repeat protein
LTADIVYFRKSQIAFEHAQRCSQERSVFWVKADTAENIISGYSAIARLTVPGFRHLTKAEILLAVKNHLESPDTLPWLLILDEANDKELFMSPSDGLNLIQYIPRSARGQVLITTRDRQITRLASGQIVPPRNSFDVKPMPNHDGFALLQKCMFSECEWLPSQNECQTFLQMLGGLPLAIIQAASYMLNTHTSVDQFVVLYMNTELHNSIFKDPAVDIDMRQMSVLYTWEISYQKIAGTGPKSRSAMLLDILGFIDSPDSGLRHLSEAEFIFKDHDEPTPIQGLEKSFETQKNPSSLLATIFDDHIEPNADHAFREYIGRLYDYSLVTTWDCWVHPVVQNWISRRPQLRLDERCQYIDWLVEKLLDQIILSDDYSENRLEHFLLPSTYNSLAAPELTPFRHAVVVLSHARLEIVAEYMASHEHFAFRLASLLYKVGRIAASMGQIVDGISYLEKAFEIMDNVENPTLLSEIRLQLAKMQQRFTFPAAAIAEARLCNEGHPSREAMLWLAQCLQSGGGLPRLQEALEWFDIINTLLTNDTEGAEVDNVVIAARVGAMQVLSEIGDHESKTRARDIIDNTLKSYFGKLPTGHMLQTILYPEILICRVDVADGHRDQADAVQRFIRHTIKAREAMQDKIIAQCSTVQDVTCPYQYLNGILPQEWLEYLLILQTKEKWAASEALADGFIQRLPPIDILIDLYWESQADPEELERFFAEIDTWGDICYNLGRACIKQGKFEKAERAHWRALGLWLYLGLFRDFSSGFDSNLRGLDKALAKQGPGRLPSLRRLRRFFKTRFVEEEETRRGLLVRTSLVGTRWN